MKTTTLYQAPACEVIDIAVEGALLAPSNGNGEGFGDGGEGTWGTSYDPFKL